MAVEFGNSQTSLLNRLYINASRNCPVGTTLTDGSRLICKAGGVAWFVAPDSTQIGSQWANNQYNDQLVGNKCCVSEWGTLDTLLSANVCGYFPTDWFVPTFAQMGNPGYLCRANWGFSAATYYTSTEASSRVACCYYFGGTFNNFPQCWCKGCGASVRAFRCVTY